MKFLFCSFLIFILKECYEAEEIQCGKKGFHNDGFRIINGTLASKGEFPWMISLRVKNGSKYKHNCGGAIISENWILTAAHCVYDMKKGSLLAVAGENNLNLEEDSEQARKVIDVFTQNFDLPTFANDIALLKLESPVVFGTNISPICLPEREQQFSGFATTAGWGSNENGQLTDLLHFVELSLIDKSICDYHYIRRGFSRLLNDHQICAGSPAGGKDACQGDSGGPLICEVNGRQILCGIVSWGIGCGKKEYPGIYTKVSCYKDWIEKTINAEIF